MQQKNQVLRALLWSFLALLIWQMIAVRIWPPAPPAPVATTQPAKPAEEVPTSADAVSTTSPAVSDFAVVGADDGGQFTLGSVEGGKESPYRAAIRLTTRGAAVEEVLLLDYKEVVERDDRYRLLHSVELKDGPVRSLALEKVSIDGGSDIRLDQLDWSASPQDTSDGQSVTFTCRIEQQQSPILKLTHHYTLPRKPASAHRFDMTSTVTIENLSDRRHEVRLTQRGPVGLSLAEPNADDRRVAAGISPGEYVDVQNVHLMSDVSKNKEGMRLFDAQRSEGKLWWLAVGNKYFTAITTPLKPDGTEGGEDIAEALAVDLDGDAATHDDVTLCWVMVPLTLEPEASRTLTMHHYLGPQDKKILRDERNEDYVRRNLSALHGQWGGSWCTFSFLTELMVKLLDLFYLVTRNYGLAIILLVIVVRALLHPVTKKTQVNMMKMQQSMATLQPKMEEIKKRFPNDKQRQQQEIMAAYREAGVNPAGQMMSCLPMFLQMPIWVALYTSLNNNIAMRHEGFVGWIKDLTSPDQLIKFDSVFHVPLIGLEISSFNLLPILMAITMYAQQKLMTKLAPTKTQAPVSEQAQMMQKQMQMMGPIMSVMFAFIFYNMPSGLNLYIMTSSIGGTLEQWRIRKHVAEEQEKAKSAPVVATGPPKKPRKPSWFERLAKSADEAQKLKSARK